MIFSKKDNFEIESVKPNNLGFLRKKLSQTEFDYLNNIKDIHKSNYNHVLAGQLHGSYLITDAGNWFFENVLKELIQKYSEEFENVGDSYPTNQRHPYYLKSMWVNYQKKHDFNPLHIHTAIYSFVVFMNIPTRHKEQNKTNDSNFKIKSSFRFMYHDILGKLRSHIIQMNPEENGTILFFPSSLYHEVFPFYNCDEDRITISGNITLNTAKSV